MNALGGEMGDYVLARASEADENQIPEDPRQFPSLVIGVDDITASPDGMTGGKASQPGA